MAIQSDNLGFLIGKPINLNRQYKQLDEIEKNTKYLVTLFKDGQKIERRIATTKPVIPRISIEKIIERNVKAGTPNKGLPTPTGGRVTVDSIMVQNAVKKANAQAKIAKQTPVIPMRKERPIIVKQNGGNVDLLPKAKAHTATLGARNAQGQFVSTQKPAITPYGKSAAGVISRQMEKNEFKEKRQWRIDLFKFMRKSDKDQRRERKKSDGLLSKIAGKAMGGARYVMGRAATGLFGGGVMGELAGMATGGMGMLGTGGRILGGAGKFLLKNPIGRMLALGGLAFGASKAFGSGGADDDKQNVAKSAGGIVGGAGGWMAGAAIGQAVIPIPVVGAIVGGLAGAFAGDSIGEKVGELLYKKDWKRGWDKVRNGMSWSFTGMTTSIKSITGWAWSSMTSFWDATWTGVGALFPNMTNNIEATFVLLKTEFIGLANKFFPDIKASIVDFIKGLRGEPTGNPEDNMTEEQKAEYHREANRFNNGDGTGTITRKLTNDEIRKYSNQENEAGRAIAYKEIAFALENRVPWIAEKTYGKDNLAQMHKDYDGDVARRKEANDILKKGTIDVKVKIGTDGKVAGEIQSDGSVTAVQPATSKAYKAGQAVRGAMGKFTPMKEFLGGNINGYSREETLAFANAVMSRENKSGRTDTVNKWGYTGKYQFGASALAATGYIDPKKLEKASRGVKNGSDADAHKAFLADKSNWLRGSWEEYKASAQMQDDSFSRLTSQNIQYGINNGINGKYALLGFAMASHLKGAGNAKRWYKFGKDSKDANGTRTSDYAQYGENSLNNFQGGVGSITKGKDIKDKGAADKYTPQGAVTTPTLTAMNLPVVNVPSFNYTVPEIQVASASVKPVRLNSDNSKAQIIQPTMLASQNLNDRLLAHVATGGIGADYRA